MFFQWSDLHSRNDPEPPQGGTQTEHELKQLLFAKWTDCFKSTEKFKRDNAKSSGLGDLKNKTKQNNNHKSSQHRQSMRNCNWIDTNDSY